MTFIQTLSHSPILALFGTCILLAILVAPIVLRIAGLSGAQIVDLLKTTARFAVNLALALRIEDDTDKTT